MCPSSSGLTLVGLVIPGPVPDEDVEARFESSVTLDNRSYTVCNGSEGFGSTSSSQLGISSNKRAHNLSIRHPLEES